MDMDGEERDSILMSYSNLKTKITVQKKMTRLKILTVRKVVMMMMQNLKGMQRV